MAESSAGQKDSLLAENLVENSVASTAALLVVCSAALLVAKMVH